MDWFRATDFANRAALTLSKPGLCDLSRVVRYPCCAGPVPSQKRAVSLPSRVASCQHRAVSCLLGSRHLVDIAQCRSVMS